MHLDAIQQNALTLRGNGDLAGARLMLEQALLAAKASLGEDHPEVLNTAHLLANMHREAGEPAAARRVLEEAVAAGQLRYGDGEPVMLALSYTLGTVADELGNRHEARRNFDRVATAGPAVLGAGHSWVRVARGYLAGEVDPGGASPVPPTPPLPASPLPASPAPVASQAVQPPAVQPPPFRPLPVQPQAVQPLPVQPQAYAPPPQRRGRGATVAAGIAAGAAVLAAAVTIVMVLRSGPADPAPPGGQAASTPSPTAEALPPGQVRISDDGDKVTLSWTDPTDGTTSFLVTGGQPGAQQRIMANVRAGETRRALNGLNPKWDYCFTIVAVYAADTLVPSDQVCTRRSTKASPTGTNR